VGVEVECKIAEAIDPRHYQEGFHSTATCGTFAAAAGIANLLGYDPATTRRALALAGSQSASSGPWWRIVISVTPDWAARVRFSSVNGVITEANRMFPFAPL